MGIIGKIGSGKSILVCFLICEYKINKNSGEILIDNKNIYDID